jgi:hypothetical protein
LVVSSSLLKRLLPARTPKPVLPATDPVSIVMRAPEPAVKAPLPESVTSPPEAVPAEVDFPASRKIAELLVFVVLMACVTDRLPSATKLMVPSVRPIA